MFIIQKIINNNNIKCILLILKQISIKTNLVINSKTNKY